MIFASSERGWSLLRASSPLVVVAAAFFVLLNCLQAPQVSCLSSSDEIRYELDRILDDNGFETDMMDLQEVIQDYYRTRRLSVENFFARMKIASLLAEIGQIKHAILSKFVSFSKESIEVYENEPGKIDLRKLELFMARCLVRSKITILLNTEHLWKQVYKFAERYQISVGTVLDALEMSNTLKDPLNADLELLVQERVLARYEAFRIEQGPESDDEADESGIDDSRSLSTLEQVDLLINVETSCGDECLALAKTPIAQGIPPLTTSASVEQWRQEFVEDIFREELSKVENLLASLAQKDIQHTPVESGECNSVSMEQVEEFRQGLRGSDKEAEYRDSFNYFME